METLEKRKIHTEYVSVQHSPIVINMPELKKLKMEVFIQLYRIMYKMTANPYKALKLIHQFRKKYKSIFGENLMGKVSKVGNKYYWRLGSPGFPSKASIKMYENELSRLLPSPSDVGMRTLFIAITKQCPLNCEHCFEWNNLNEKDILQTRDIIQIVYKYQDFGTTQIMFSGGEPILRINDLCEILKAARPGTDFWVITSGLGLDIENARKLKAAGLTGVMVSLDHHKASMHNNFRGNVNVYNWALQAVANANEEGLVTAFALCATKSFVTHENLTAYMNLAKNLGVSFVQILEPRATGRYFGKDVMLGNEEIELLDKTYLKYNSSNACKEYPIINYLGYHQRIVGCFGGGNRFFYIDADGDAHLCPFCKNKIGNTLELSAKQMVNKLSNQTCHIFEISKL